MNSTIDLEKCHTFINCHMQPAVRPAFRYENTGFTAVTISRQAGSGGRAVGERLAGLLQQQEPPPIPPWTVFDKNLVEKVLEDHKLPGHLAKFMPEDHVSEIDDIMDELFGLHPPSWILVRQTSETILQLAKLGNAIIIGRGANVVTRRLPHVFHVRLVGSLQRRVKRLQDLNHVTHESALKLAHGEDQARQRYLKQFFDKNIDDPLLYHLVINTDLSSTEEIARMIAGELAPRAEPVAA